MVRPTLLAVPSLLLGVGLVLLLASPARPDGVGPPAADRAAIDSATVTSRVIWVLSQQADDGGFGEEPARRRETTALVVLGLADARVDVPGRRPALRRAIEHLIAHQDKGGAFREAGGQDRTLLALVALLAYREDDGRRASAGLALLEGDAPPGRDGDLVRAALTLLAR